MVKNKKVLLICPKFFGYEEKLFDAINRLGFYVDYLDERPSNKVVFKAILRLGIRAISDLINESYYNDFCKRNVKKYDYVLYFNIESINKEILISLRNSFPKAKHILYMWDSVKNKPNYLELTSLFDRCYTFDPKDAENNAELNYKPLFSCMKPQSRQKKTFDYSFVGTVHGSRLPILLKLDSMIRERELTSYLYFYYPSRTLWMLRCIFDKRLKLSYFNKVNFKPLEYKKVESVVRQSKFVIDVPNSDQVGMTMRNVEVVCAGTKILTTNKTAINTEFYQDGMIMFFCENNIVLPYNGVYNNSEVNYSNYYIDNWLKEILIS
ncbi:Glycosyltransferase [Vibrio owensii]|uniref:hypothetical protein n=1 Tax=Vibrio owensii TaxID=696485 RepID=UPI0028943EC1|nr:Glycosyltransferase [Vibrio owensii]